MTNHRIKFITSTNLSSLELQVNNWLKKEINIHIRQMSFYTDINNDYEMTLMIWYDVANDYTKGKKQQKIGKNDTTGKEVEELAKISSART
jgi:hypothetical protein